MTTCTYIRLAHMPRFRVRDVIIFQSDRNVIGPLSRAARVLLSRQTVSSAIRSARGNDECFPRIVLVSSLRLSKTFEGGSRCRRG